MSEAEIHYYVPADSRGLGDVESITNAVGQYQSEIPFPLNAQYHFIPKDVENGAAMLVLQHADDTLWPESRLIQRTETMRKGVEKHFSDADRARLSSYFAGIAKNGILDVE